MQTFRKRRQRLENTLSIPLVIFQMGLQTVSQMNFNEHVFSQAQLLAEERRLGQDKGIFR